jgi:alpha-L-fucosidase
MITTSWNEVEYTAADGKVYVKYVASNIDELYAEGEKQAAENAANPQNDAAKTLVGLTTAQAVQLRLDNYTDLLRQTRNQLLLESDWTQGADSVLNSTKKAEWQTYRQSLRDITSGISSVTDVENITWPTKPS